MTCREPNATIEILQPDGTLDMDPLIELRPITFNFQRHYDEFDFLNAEFSDDVAEFIQPSVNGGILRENLVAVLRFDGTPVHRFFYRPESVTFGDYSVTIEFHDCQKSLTEGVVDFQRQNVTLRDAYEYIFERRGEDDFLKEIRFSVPDDTYEELISYRTPGGAINPRLRIDRRRIDAELAAGGTSQENFDKTVRTLEEENIANVIDGKYAINVEQVSPWEAILELNQKFGVRTWTTPGGILYVGSPEATGIDHFAAVDDDRAWVINDYELGPPKNPIRKAVVRGKFVNDPSERALEQIWENISGKGKEYIVEGVAERPDIDKIGSYTLEPKQIDAAKDALGPTALRRLVEAQKAQWSGSIEILPESSGTFITDPRFVYLGDQIVTIPPEEPRHCNKSLKREKYNITGIRHEFDDTGKWVLELDVVPVMDGDLHPSNIETHIRYFNPTTGNYVDEEVFL